MLTARAGPFETHGDQPRSEPGRRVRFVELEGRADGFGLELPVLVIVDVRPALLEPYGVTRAKLLQALAVELLRIVVEVR